MDESTGVAPSRTRRWAARLAITTAGASVIILVVMAGLRGVGLLAIGLAGAVVMAAALWWALTRRGLVRMIAVALAVAAPVAVIVLEVASGLLRVLLVYLALGAVATAAGWAALAEAKPTVPRTRSVPPPQQPVLIMNPHSGGGKVGRFGLREKAEALGARVVLLDPAHHVDVAALARQAVAEGADLLGVAGGDGTQALVAGVAAEHDIPFLVVPAGTRNHFAMDLGLDREDPSPSLNALTDGIEMRIDLGLIGDRIFVNNASFGAYAAIVQSDAYRDDKVGTALQMLPDVLTHRVGPRLTVRTKGFAVDSPQAVLVSNNPYRVGDRAGLGRRDRLDSGVLGLVSITVDSAAGAAELLRGERAPGLTVLTTEEVLVGADSNEIQAGVDGEALTFPAPVHCSIRPAALRVRVPQDRPGVPRPRPRLDWRRLGRLALPGNSTRPASAAGHGQRPD
ncbi:diacylglycerol/lipid kinase family protein [Streptomyces sp. NPDC058620]|uniref:diacylglycerol/lipid kinase family protein n=1 Tax=Streptomyces sp. NPDC058620 TaxID=3346560 RepID=UPI003666F093